jgi:hypothetical protein
MVRMRVYLPLTMARLATLAADRRLSPPPLPGFAVTSRFRDEHGEDDGDDESLEYEALGAAAFGSLRQLAAEADATEGAETAAAGIMPRRVVLAAEVPDQTVTESERVAGEVLVNSDILLSAVKAVHVDDTAAADDVRAGVRALVELGQPPVVPDQEAPPALDAVEEHELLWYATQEIPDLLG